MKKQPIQAKTRRTSKLARNLSADEVNACSKLTYGGSSVMLRELRRAQDEQNDSLAVMIRADGEIISWGLLYFDSDERAWVATFYTRPVYRRQGLGRRVAERLTEIQPTAMACPWNKVSRSFFSNFSFGKHPTLSCDW